MVNLRREIIAGSVLLLSASIAVFSVAHPPSSAGDRASEKVSHQDIGGAIGQFVFNNVGALLGAAYFIFELKNQVRELESKIEANKVLQSKELELISVKIEQAIGGLGEEVKSLRSRVSANERTLYNLIDFINTREGKDSFSLRHDYEG